MCGRFNVIDSPGLRQLLQDLGIDLQLPRAVNVAPTEPVSLVRDLAGERRLDSARWWLTPSWARAVDQKYAMFNARSETLASSRAFRHPFRSQRGIVPMSSFIEWRQEGGLKQPWLISNERGALAAAASSFPCSRRGLELACPHSSGARAHPVTSNAHSARNSHAGPQPSRLSARGSSHSPANNAIVVETGVNDMRPWSQYRPSYRIDGTRRSADARLRSGATRAHQNYGQGTTLRGWPDPELASGWNPA